MRLNIYYTFTLKFGMRLNLFRYKLERNCIGYANRTFSTFTDKKRKKKKSKISTLFQHHEHK